MRATSILFAVAWCASAAEAAPPAGFGPPPVGCTDGGFFDGARVTPREVRYCVDKACWSFDRATHALAPLAHAEATASRPGDVEIPVPGDPPPAPPALVTASVIDLTHVQVCERGACAPLPLAPVPRGTSDMVEEAIASPSGARVAVIRGAAGPGGDRDWIEIYDRATARRRGHVRPHLDCSRFVAWAGETAVIQEWGCAQKAGPWVLVGPRGTQLARAEHTHAPMRPPLQIAGARWAFQASDAIEIYDVESGRQAASVAGSFESVLAVVDGALFAFDPDGGVRVFDRDGALLGGAQPPTCRWHYETEALGGVQLGMTGPALEKRLGRPRATSKPDAEGKVTVTYPGGLSLVLQTYVRSPDPCAGGAQPATLVAIAAHAPSKLATTAGIAIGATADAARAAYAGHLDLSRSSATALVFGNPGDTGGVTLELAGEVVTGIRIAE